MINDAAENSRRLSRFTSLKTPTDSPWVEQMEQKTKGSSRQPGLNGKEPVAVEATGPEGSANLLRGLLRVGDDMVGNLGETENSFGFGGTGKFSTAWKFAYYGDKYGVGDTIVCAVNLVNKPFPFMRFSKDRKWSGPAKFFNTGSNGLGILDSQIRKLPWESALLAHLLLKNVFLYRCSLLLMTD
ncbi:hypothetical protein Vadar_024518 [Vaccinium darrowii]|uniref:Uncharacterized protein n=1 Tax=Vaccinium darrowii TaxID=229202 RepID=A0ACB7ZL32_9ERIC|nr:hypothetical protein Vadar_024518 [Vaccinium darrowii]